MSQRETGQFEAEIEQIKQALQRQDISRDAVSLLSIRLIELRNPHGVVKLASEEAVEIAGQDGKKVTIFLANLLAEAERNPSERLEIVERYLRVHFQGAENDLPLRENVISTVRHADYRTFLKEADRDLVTEHLVGELWTVWAIDYPESISVISTKQIDSMKLTKDDLRSLGLANARRLLGDLECESQDTFFILNSINSVYLSSSLLMDEVWNSAKTLVNGDLVVSAPARDTVIFTGTQNSEGLRVLREQAAYVIKNGDHVLSEALFQWVDSKWVPFT